MNRILLTGATGFLGSALARHWAGAGREVHALVRPPSSRRRLAGLEGAVTLHELGGASAAEIVARVRPDAVVHTACAYGRAGESPRQVFEANLSFGIELLQAVLSGPDAVTFLNTGSVLEPDVSLYALSKFQFSQWGAQLAARQPARLRFLDLRLQHMYGAGDDPSKFTTHVLQACLRNEPELKLTAGEQQRDFIHVDDVVTAYDTVLARAPTLAAHERIDVGSGSAPSIREFVEIVHRLTGATTRLAFGAVPYRPNEAMLCRADTQRLRALGWRPRFDLASGLQDTLRKESLQ
ncbi:MAG TPA: NAD-dependent epimerase/dehydratase [Burkholderiaceae bacterium]